MFGSSQNPTTMSKTNPTEAAINLIGAGTVIEGDIKSNGDVRIDGNLKGSLNSKGKLVLGATGSIDGEVVCQNADISGNIKGKLTVNELLALKASAKINGDIVTNKLAIEPGANFTGSCSMGAVIKDFKQVERTEEKRAEKTA